MKIRTKIIIISTFLSVNLHAQTEIEKHIESSFQACIEQTDDNTIAISMCTNQYYKSWDSILNVEYQLLMNNIPKVDAKRLRLSQRKWLETKELDRQFHNQYSERQEGTMWGFVSAFNSAQSTKYRALYLNAIRKDIVKTK